MGNEMHTVRAMSADVTACVMEPGSSVGRAIVDPLGVVSGTGSLVMSDLVRARWLVGHLLPAFLDAAGLGDAATTVRAIAPLEARHVESGRYPRGAVKILHEIAPMVDELWADRWNFRLREQPYDVPMLFDERGPGPRGRAFLDRMDNTPSPELWQVVQQVASDTRWVMRPSHLGWWAYNVWSGAARLVRIDADGQITPELMSLYTGVWQELVYDVVFDPTVNKDVAVGLDLDAGVVRVTTVESESRPAVASGHRHD